MPLEMGGYGGAIDIRCSGDMSSLWCIRLDMKVDVHRSSQQSLITYCNVAFDGPIRCFFGLGARSAVIQSPPQRRVALVAGRSAKLRDGSP